MKTPDIAGPLLAWYEKNKRELPWRSNIAPYTVLVSELMAQQTRIAQLLPYYVRFMENFPTLESLAAADINDVLSVWAGMGYYARARSLHATARIIAHERGGQWPRSREAWERLPGIGAYTAGAVMSIAFGAREAAVDGNALRVYARLADDGSKKNALKKSAGVFIKEAMPENPDEISPFTQSLMELGALVCVPGKPLCGNCPLETLCRARKAGRESMLPAKTPKKPSPLMDITVLVIINPEGNALMRRRTEKLLNGMWVYYLCEGEMTGEEAEEHAAGLGYTVNDIYELGSAKHAFTHRVWRMNGYAVHVSENHTVNDYCFLSKEEMKTAAIPAAMKYYSGGF